MAKLNITRTLGSKGDWRFAKFWQDATERAPIIARFWSCVNRLEPDACWLWTGYIATHGYGVFGIGNHPQIRVRAHRLAWLIVRGAIPVGLEVCHRCDHPACVNPEHLFVATHRDNHLDSVRKGRKRVWGVQKLNAEQVREIRARAATGSERQQDIAAAFRIARNTVSQIVNRKAWAHLDAVHARQSRKSA